MIARWLRGCNDDLVKELAGSAGDDRLDCYLLHWRGRYALEETIPLFSRSPKPPTLIMPPRTRPPEISTCRRLNSRGSTKLFLSVRGRATCRCSKNHLGHPVVASIKPGERWAWCYVDQFELAMPFLLATSGQCVFAAGDLRSGSIKRVASDVGEAAMAVQFVHEVLKSL
jgi:hypothetical protein